ncbi:MAG: phosphoadenylyl-sulfate reductase [Leptospirales bacterium]
MQEFIKKHKENLEGKTPLEIIQTVSSEFPKDSVFSSSLGLEDQVISDIILTNNLPVEIFTLDTGRHFAQTYQVHERVNDKYKTRIKTYYPDTSEIEKFVNTNGPDAFYLSPELRKQCCHIRKVQPLERALKGKKVWFTGIRREQSEDRASTPVIEFDQDHDLIKVHPLVHWKIDEVWDHVKKNNVPYNALHNKGFISIGCAPCTRAIAEGEDSRTGRWWWESGDLKECGLHVPHKA